MVKNEEKLRNACESASQAFAKLKDEKYDNIKSKLEYCVGSYDYDKNPEGLVEYGNVALEELRAAKTKYPRKFNKKIITDLEAGLK